MSPGMKVAEREQELLPERVRGAEEQKANIRGRKVARKVRCVARFTSRGMECRVESKDGFENLEGMADEQWVES